MFCGQGCLSGSRPGKPICQLHGDPESWPRASLIVTRSESSCDAGCLGARRIAERGGRSRRWEHEQNLGMCGKRHHCPRRDGSHGSETCQQPRPQRRGPLGDAIPPPIEHVHSPVGTRTCLLLSLVWRPACTHLLGFLEPSVQY